MSAAILPEKGNKRNVNRKRDGFTFAHSSSLDLREKCLDVAFKDRCYFLYSVCRRGIVDNLASPESAYRRIKLFAECFKGESIEAELSIKKIFVEFSCGVCFSHFG